MDLLMAIYVLMCGALHEFMYLSTRHSRGGVGSIGGLLKCMVQHLTTMSQLASGEDQTAR